MMINNAANHINKSNYNFPNNKHFKYGLHLKEGSCCVSVKVESSKGNYIL